VHARHDFNSKRAKIEKALKAARALCRALEALGAPPNVHWAHHHDVTLFRKVISKLPDVHRLLDELEALTAEVGNFKERTGRPRDYEKPEFQRIMVSLLPDRLQRSGRRFDKEFAELYQLVSGREQEPESYNRTRRAKSGFAHANPSHFR
jgi:hypothetical protein